MLAITPNLAQKTYTFTCAEMANLIHRCIDYPKGTRILSGNKGIGFLKHLDYVLLGNDPEAFNAIVLITTLAQTRLR